MRENLPQLPSVRIAAGLGGSLDVWAGKCRRAPVGWQQIGMEWAWRMMHEPERFKHLPALFHFARTAGRALLCVEAVRQAKSAITDKPVIAGMIGPYSLAGRLMDVTEIMYLCFDEPETVHTVLDKAAQYLIKYGQAMKAAGADGVMMAEPLAGILSPAMAEEFSMPYVARIIATLQDEDFAVIYHNCGNAVPQMLESIYAQGAAAYHFGNAVDMTAILQATPADVLVMGNIDPAGEFASGTVESITAATRELMAKCGAYRNFLPSSGCDIPAHAKWENIHAFFAAIRS